MSIKGVILSLAFSAAAFPAMASSPSDPQVEGSNQKSSQTISVSVMTPSSSKVTVIQPKDGRSSSSTGTSYENPVKLSGSKTTSKPAPSSPSASKPASTPNKSASAENAPAPAKPAPSQTSPAKTSPSATNVDKAKPTTSAGEAIKSETKETAKPATTAKPSSSYGKTIVNRTTSAPGTEFLPSHKSSKQYVASPRTNIHFREGQVALDQTYMNNAATLETFVSYVKSVGTAKIASILIVSKDSPDGLSKDNVKRAEQRAAIVAAYVGNQFPELANVISVSPDGESWDLLRAYIASDKDMNLDYRIRAIDYLSPDENIFKRKEALKNGGLGIDPVVGDISAYVREKYFPLIRNTAIYIELKK